MRICESAGVHRRLLRVAIAAGAVVLPATAVAQASAATLTMSARCYVNPQAATGAMIDVIGTGYTPGDSIQVSGFGVAGHTTAAPDGSFNLVTQGPTLPFIGPGQKSFALQSQDETSGTGFLASTSVTMANFAVDTVPAVAKPSRKVTWHFSGFRPGRTIYVHYLHRGTVKERMAFGRAQGPCGTLKARDKFYPGGHPHFGTYQVVFDQVKRYTRRARPRISTKLSFF